MARGHDVEIAAVPTRTKQMIKRRHTPVVKIRVIGPDAGQRVAAYPSLFSRVPFDASPLAAEGTLEKSEGYAATPLTGVWANYPYFTTGVCRLFIICLVQCRNGRRFSASWPRAISIASGSGRSLYPDPGDARLGELQLLRRYGADRTGSTRRATGAATADTTCGSRIKTDENRRALIEYLKTL